MSVTVLPVIRPIPEQQIDIGPDRGIQLPNPQNVGRVDSNIPEGGFERVLHNMVQHSAALDDIADAKAADFAQGRTDDVHGTMIAAKKAEISVKLVGEVRNKLLDAFQELWRMNV